MIGEERGKRSRRRIWAVLEGAGLSNRLRKCNAEFYNVRDIHALARACGRVRRLAPASQVVARAAPALDPGMPGGAPAREQVSVAALPRALTRFVRTRRDGAGQR